MIKYVKYCLCIALIINIASKCDSATDPPPIDIDNNSIPTSISLNNTNILENQPIGTTVGLFSTEDQDTEDTHTYTFVSGSGDTDNTSFSISGNTLQTSASFDFESQSSYSIRVQTDDSNQGLFEMSFIITVLDANRYIAIGNSITAGFMDAALYTDGQSNSFPNILSTQLQLVQFVEPNFNQPDINSEFGFSSIASDGTIFGRGFLNISNTNDPIIGFATGGNTVTPYTGDKSLLNNFGVPGANLRDLKNPDFGSSNNTNPYYSRFATNPGTSTVLGDALAVNSDFFTLWIGTNDILVYALPGADPVAAGVSITSQSEFQTDFEDILGQLTAKGSRGVVINIPPIVTLPFFTTILYNSVPIDALTASLLNSQDAFGGFNTALDDLVTLGIFTQTEADSRKITFTETTTHPLLIFDEELSNLSGNFDLLLTNGLITSSERDLIDRYTQVRLATSEDLIPLTAGLVIGNNVNNDITLIRGVSVALEDSLVLTSTEQAQITAARSNFNQIIENTVQQINSSAGNNNVILLDVQPIFADILGLTSAEATSLALSVAAQSRADGIPGILVDSEGRSGPDAVGGDILLADISTQSVFSVDGLHPNPMGHALIANEIIKLMNTNYGISVPLSDILGRRSIFTQ